MADHADVIHSLTPGGPIERQIMAYKMALAGGEGGAGATGGAVGFGTELPPDAVEQLREDLHRHRDFAHYAGHLLIRHLRRVLR